MIWKHFYILFDIKIWRNFQIPNSADYPKHHYAMHKQVHGAQAAPSSPPPWHMIIPRSLIEIFYARLYMMLIFN